MIPFLVLFSLLCRLSPALPLPAQQAGEEESAPQPEFRSKRAQESFSKGVEAFKARKYSDAQKHFKVARSGAKGAADKQTVDGWLAGSVGGVRLAVFQRYIAQNRIKETFFQAQDDFVKYMGTPIEPDYRQFLATLTPKALHDLEDFEYGKKFDEKFGKKYIDAAGAAVHGRKCLEWGQTPDRKAAQLRLSSVPKSLSRYDGIVFWIFVLRSAEIELIVKSPGKSQQQVNSLMAKFKPKATGGWQRIYMPFDKRFKVFGKGTFASVEDVIFQIRTRNDFRLRIDWIALVNKDPGSK